MIYVCIQFYIGYTDDLWLTFLHTSLSNVELKSLISWTILSLSGIIF